MGTSPFTQHYKYNGSSWSSVSTLPYAFSNASAVVYDNKIHILGSSNSTSTRQYHYILCSTQMSVYKEV